VSDVLYTLADFGAAADGVRDDSEALQRCFAAVRQGGGGVVTIPPGDYRVRGATPVALCSRTTVQAHGARFHLPDELGAGARLVLFSGEDVSDFAWEGGAFCGHCFDYRRPANSWAPSANTRVLVFSTTPGGRTANLTFRGIQGERIAGAVITVQGAAQPESESAVQTFAENIAVRDCRLRDCGKFMWDYGLLWQILVFAAEYTSAEVDLAWLHFRQDLVRRELRLREGDDRVGFDNGSAPVALSAHGGADQAVCFFGRRLPPNVVRGRKYYVVASAADHIKVSESPGGEPLRFAGQGEEAGLIVNLSQAFYHLYVPIGAGPGIGGVDLVCCRNTTVSGCTLSALGDTMHIQRCHNNVFAGNQITGSRMGAFFLAEYCRNSTVTGNTVDGTNGSRVMSVEKSSEDVTIIGNTFRNGGRGSWINQPRNIILQGNIFVHNTTKCERDPQRGRRSFETGDYERYSEIYFTLHQPNGTYGPVILKDNLFVTGAGCRHAVEFGPQGHDLLVDGNILSGPARSVAVDPSCTGVCFGRNPGLSLQ
jgi:hypothetical protein